MTVNESLSAAQRAWCMLWDRGKHADHGETRHTLPKHKKTHKQRITQKNRRTKRGRQYQQTTMHGANLDSDDMESFGDDLQAKHDNILRVGFQNIHNLPEDCRTAKSRQLVDYVVQKSFDCFMMAEVGLNWTKIRASNRWFERVSGKFKTSRSVFAHNVTELHQSKTLQPGGVGLISTDEVTHRITDTGKDLTGLGRWCWTRFQGKNGIKVRTISVYRPCDAPGATTTYQQQLRFLRYHDAPHGPREALYDDLYTECLEWMEEGDQLIIGIDANEDIRTGATANMFQALGMNEAILHKHSESSPPATHNRNQRRQPIDGLFVTPGLKAVAAGYTPFGSGCPSDHRVLWADFTYADAFGTPSAPLVSPGARRLNTKNPRLVEKYVLQLRQQLESSGLAKRLFTLEVRATQDGWSSPLQLEYNDIQTTHLRLRKLIERKLRKLRMGGVPWSPKLQVFRNTIELWTMIARKRKGVKVSTTRIRRFMAKTGIWDAFTFDLQEAELKVKESHKKYRSAKSDASVWRDDFLYSLADAKAAKNGTSTDLELKQLMRVEGQKTQARNVKRMLKKLGNPSTTKLYHTREGVRTECTDKLHMENACIAENTARFSQTESTPPMTEPLVSDLGYLADTEAAERILDGSYDIPADLDPYAVQLIRELRMPDRIRNSPFVTSRVETTDHRMGWNKQKETISADPDGLTFSHYKAGATDDLISQFDATLRSLPYQHGFTPDSWIPMTDVAILKKAGVYDVEKMRTILLMNAEFNMNNKKLGRDMMANAERHAAVAREQYGSRRHHQCILAALNKRLTMDNLRQAHRAGALCANDAKSCYDRVVHSIASLAMRRMGVPANPIKSMFSTLQQASHKVRTAFGTSDQTYGKGRDPPLQGFGQGNGCGPSGWAVISTPLINLVRTAGFGFFLLTALTVSVVSFVCFAFVDDTDVVHTAKDVDTPGETVAQEMQQAIDHWEGGLKATGGALVPEKSYWYLIDFVWTGECWRYATIEDIPGDISINNADDSGREVLHRYEATEANKTLGIFLAMDGNNQEETRYLRTKADEFADCVRTGFLSRADATYALHRTIMKTLEYPMVATTMNKPQWEYIMAPILTATLPRMGYVRRFPRDVVYSPASFCGLGVMHPWHNQHLSQMKVLLQETSLPTITGDLIRASMEQLRLEIGLPGRSDRWNWKVIECLATDCWVKDLLHYMALHDFQLTDTLPTLRSYRTADKFLMTEFIASGYFKKDLQMLNECRKYLQVTTLAEITSADGLYLADWAWNGYGTDDGMNEYQWPRRPTLQPRYWRFWQQALQATFLHSLQTTERKLRHPLGQWDHDIPSTWKWFFSSAEDRVYHFEGIGWRVFSRIPSRVQRLRSLRFIRQAYIAPNLPIDAAMASISRTREGVRLTGVNATPPGATPTTASHPCTITDALSNCKAPDLWSVQSVDVVDNGVSIAAAIIRGDARAVSDGSFKNAMGTSASILFHTKSTDPRRIISVNSVPGNRSEQSAYRSELAGVSGSLSTIAAVCTVHDLHTGSITIGLDGEQAMIAASEAWPLSPERPDYDLLTDIRSKVSRLPITVHWKWIKGHQDDFQGPLDEWARANIYMDSMAKAYWNYLNNTGHCPSPQRFGDEAWSISFQERKLSRLDKNPLYNAIMEPVSKAYWQDKGHMTTDDISNIDWDLVGKAFTTLTSNLQRRVTKHAAGHFGCGKMMQIWKFQDHAECPRCSDPYETPTHILTCPAPSANRRWETALTVLEEWMTKNHTMPALQMVLLRCLREWRHPNPRRRVSRSSITSQYGLREATLQQDDIGWYNFMMGRPSIRWRDVQHRYYEWLKKRNTGKAWLQALIKKVWAVSWDMWDHRNHVRLNTTTSAMLREITALNASISDQFELGTGGLGPSDHHLLGKPVAHVLSYDVEHKAQWLESVELARTSFASRHELESSPLRRQREFMASWRLTATLPATPLAPPPGLT